MKRKKLKHTLVIFIAFWSAPTVSLAQWSSDPTINVAICTDQNDQYSPKIVSDGSGGTIIAWEDYRSGNYMVYAQRVDAAGVAQWTTQR